MRLIPNFLSSLRILFILPIIYSIQNELYLFAAILFFISSSTDFFDGYLARRYSVETELGAFLDLIADKIFESSLDQDEDEDITLEEYTLEESFELIKDNKIIDQGTITALNIYKSII